MKTSFTANAGFPSPAEGQMDRALDLNEYIIRNPAATFFVRARGDSMVHAGIFDGDVLVVDRSRKPSHRDIIIANLDGHLLVKRLLKDKRLLRLISENDDRDSLVINGEQALMVWGVVTFVLHRTSH